MRPGLVTLALFLVSCPGGKDDVEDVNHQPVADAGSEVVQPANHPVHLDGRSSYDPDGDELTYSWAFDYAPEGSALPERQAPFDPNHDTSGATTFQPDRVGAYLVQLVVHDGERSSKPALVVVNATEPDELPTADCGSDVVAVLGDTVTLDGSSSSDPLGGSLTWSWSLSSVPYNSTLGPVDLVGPDTVSPSFVPDVRGEFIVSLVVDNGLARSAPDSVTVSVQGGNLPPIADAGADQAGEDCTLIELDGSASSDPEGARLFYFWELQVKPPTSATGQHSFSDRTAIAPTFWPDVAGRYEISCSVYDGLEWSEPDTLALLLAERAVNSAPSVDAGPDRIEPEPPGEATCVKDGYVWDCDDCMAFTTEIGTGGGISDADGDPLVIAWEVLDGDAAVIDADVFPSTAILDETQPDQPGSCTETPVEFKVSATDCPGTTSIDTVLISVECCGVKEAEE